jgi:hypothetical protein
VRRTGIQAGLLLRKQEGSNAVKSSTIASRTARERSGVAAVQGRRTLPSAGVFVFVFVHVFVCVCLCVRMSVSVFCLWV